MNTLDELELIKKNIKSIQRNAADIFEEKYIEPTKKEYNIVKKIILKYIQDNNRIIYGGYAQNELIKDKDINDDFYKNTRADVEFYTPEPIKDMIELCDILYKKKIPNIEGKQGVHNETYKIFANFENYCDISYMDPFIYKNCPTIKLNNLLFTHPHFMLIDAYRVYTDPMTSFYRIDKNLERFPLLEKHYPFDNEYLKINYNKIINNKLNLDILRL